MADRIVMAEEADRTPNWNKWRLIPDPKQWQCVALSLNIDPDTVDYDEYVDDEGPAECREFKDRLDVVNANLHKTLQPTTPGGFPYSPTVSLRQFAAWVRDIGWAAPPELLAMADEQAATEQNTPVERRAHNKRATEAGHREWQERINKLAQDSPGKSHADYCRTLSKQIKVSFQTIRRNTKLRHS